MIVFRYTKQDGAEYISHLDTLRHLNKTFIRGGIPVRTSQGFHPHRLVYMSSPIGVGLKSLAEYCTVDTDMSPETFREVFNASSPKGIRCVEAYYSEKNVNLASAITRAQYYFEGVGDFSPEEVLSQKEFFVRDKKGEEKDVRGKIHSLRRRGKGWEAVLAAGNASLRPDVFIAALLERFGGERYDVIKEESFVGEGERVETLLTAQTAREGE